MFEHKGIAFKKITEITVGIIAILWLYTAVSKLINFQDFRDAMKKQPFGTAMQIVLIYGLPPVEIITGLLLTCKKGILPGLYISVVLFTAFTIYILLILLKFFGHVPCSCGGLIEQMGWGFHLWFNIVFFILTCISIIIINKRKEFGDT